MNKIVASPNLLEDEKLNAKIERFFDNQTFQKMVEGTDVFQDVSNYSLTNSLILKNQQKLLEQKSNNFKLGTESSWEAESLPGFGGSKLIFYFFIK